MYLLQLYPRPSIMITRGQGAFLYDTLNREYIDFGSGIAVNALGYNHPIITRIVKDQVKKCVHLSNLFHNEYAGPFAKALVDPLVAFGGRWASGAKVFFGNSGTEANEGMSLNFNLNLPRDWTLISNYKPAKITAAIKFSRKYAKSIHPKNPTKHNILSFHNSFHGRSLGALSATPNKKYQMPFLPLLPGFEYANYNDLSAVDMITDNTCAVILEPLQGEGGIFEARVDFLEAVRRKCDEVGALLVYDEIQVCFLVDLSCDCGSNLRPFIVRHWTNWNHLRAFQLPFIRHPGHSHFSQTSCEWLPYICHYHIGRSFKNYPARRPRNNLWRWPLCHPRRH